jgi:hypothetical protein
MGRKAENAARMGGRGLVQEVYIVPWAKEDA